MEQSTLQLWDVIGTWVASIGTVSAVITSLWLAYHQSKLKLKVASGIRQLITPGSDHIPEYCVINVVNTGSKPAKITNISWEAGRFKDKKCLIQLFGYPGFDSIPKVLAEGEEANFMVPLRENGDQEDWIVRFSINLLKDNPRIVSSLKACVHTSVGQSFKVRAEKALIDELAKSFEANH